MSEGNVHVSIQEVIPFIEKQSVIWDHNLESFKNKQATLAAWNEVCSQYNKTYAKMSKDGRDTYRSIVFRKWKNVKDSYRKNVIKNMRCNKKYKPYIYDRELAFLKKTMEEMSPKPKRKFYFKQKQTKSDTEEDDRPCSILEIECLKEEIQSFDSEEPFVSNEAELISELDYYCQSDMQDNERITETNDKKFKRKTKNAKPKPKSKRKRCDSESLDELPPESATPKHHELKTSRNVSAETENRHICFMKGILPSLEKLNERQILKFQMGVCQLIQDIEEGN